MKFVLFTSDNYVNIVNDHAFLFNRFGGEKINVSVLGFNPPKEKLPNNFEFISMGKQSDFSKRNWADPIRPFIEEIKENYFCLTWDDLFPIGDIDHNLLNQGIELVSSNHASRVGFFFGSKIQFQTSHYFNKDFNQLDQLAEYRSSLEPAIWSKEYFLNHLKSEMSPWDYEVKNMSIMNNDNKVILNPSKKPIYPWANIFKGGSFNSKIWNDHCNKNCFGWNEFQRLDKETAQLIEKYRNIRNIR